MSGLVLVDTSVWADHINHSDFHLSGLLEERRVVMHPFVIGELAMGNLKRRAVILHGLHALPEAARARDDEVLAFISDHVLFGRGISYIDVHLLTAAKLTASTTLWTRDRRLRQAAEAIQLDFKEPRKM